MHIAFLCNEYPPGPHGGVGTFTQTMARALVSQGWKVTVLGGYPSERAGVETDNGVRVVRLAASPLRGIGAWLNGARLAAAVRQLEWSEGLDLIEGAELSLGFLPKRTLACKIIRMHGGHNFFYTAAGRKPRFWRKWLERVSFSKADALCAVSQYVASTTLQLLGQADRPVTILPNPVDTDVFQPGSAANEEPGGVFFAGALCEKKGIRQLVHALPMIARQVPEVRLYAAGRDTIDPQTGDSYRSRLIREVPEAESRIQFLGHLPQKEIIARIQKAQVCVYPSHMEAQGIVVLEGMSCGKAVVASQTGPGPELIVDGEAGLLCDPKKPETISNSVTLILQNSSLRQKLGKNARKRVLEQFSLDILLEKNIRFYEACKNIS